MIISFPISSRAFVTGPSAENAVIMDSTPLAGCHARFGGTANDLTPLWMGLTGAIIVGLFGLNRFRQRTQERAERQIITDVLANGKAMRAIDILKAARGNLPTSSIFETLTKMEDEGLVESWDAKSPNDDAEISRARGFRLYRLKKKSTHLGT